MANDKDKIYEKIYFLWKGEGEKQNKSIDWYCERYHVSVEVLRRWFKEISKAVKEIKVVGGPTAETVEVQAEGLTPEQIYERSNGAETNEIVANLCVNLNDMLNIKEDLSSLMQKAVIYMQSFWKQLMAYRHDGSYSIDNNIAERSIRPMTLQRKSSLMYGSQKGVEISTIYYTLIETCRLNKINPRRFLQNFFEKMLAGRTDYKNLLPMTIGEVLNNEK